MFIPHKSDQQHAIPRPEQYTLYGWQQSYFTRKLQAALNFYAAPYQFVRKNAANEQELRIRSGTHQVPVLHTPENWMIADTTPLMMMLDHRFPGREMFPSGTLGVLTHILEEYFDEWIARTTVHWRWAYEENHELLSMDAAAGDPALAAQIAAWGQRVCRATGVASDTQKQAAEEEYHRILAAAEQQLSHTAYLLGDRPTALDCIVLAGLRAHFNHDPAPRRAIHDRYPRTIAWCEQDDRTWQGDGDLASFPQSTAFAHHILGEMVNTYAPFALGNRKALADGERAFVIPVYGEEVSYLARPYIEQSRQMIIERIKQLLGNEEREQVQVWLESAGLATAFEAD